MKFLRTPIEGAWVIELEPRDDDRGSFARALCLREMAAQGIEFSVVQVNLARTLHAGTVRGLHFQPPPHDEQKLVRCIVGAVHDVIIDMRPASSSFRKVFEIHLDPVNRLSLFVPAGVAHGYQVLVDDTEFLYLTDQYYQSGLECGVRFDDPALAAHWPLTPRGVTERDGAWPMLEQ